MISVSNFSKKAKDSWEFGCENGCGVTMSIRIHIICLRSLSKRRQNVLYFFTCFEPRVKSRVYCMLGSC